MTTLHAVTERGDEWPARLRRTEVNDPLVLRRDSGGVATLVLNRPDKLNALSPAVFVALRSHLDALAEDDKVGCVVVTGAGRAFCAGHDLASISAGDPAPSEDFEAATIDALEALPQPTIARINGHCYTGGLELALACDLLVAGRSAMLGDTHGQWGLAPVWGLSVRLPERVGLSAAKELAFTSRRIPAAEAFRLRLVDRFVDDQELDDTVDRLAAEIVGNSWGTNRIDKQLFAFASNNPRAAALAHERTLPYGLPADMVERMSRAGRRIP